MGRPKGSKNKPKAQPPAKAGKVGKVGKVATKAEPPDWLRKAMTPAKTPQKRGPKPKALKEKFQQQAKAKRGKTPMANKPHYDPMDDPDLRAKDDALITPAPPKPDQALPGNPIKPGKPAPLPGGGVAPEAKAAEPAPEQQFDEVQSGAEIPYENAETLIAGTLGGSGDAHANAQRILLRFEEALWVISKALDAGIGDTRSKNAKRHASWKPRPEDLKKDDQKDADAVKGKGKTDASIRPDDRKDDERKDDKR